MQLLSPAGRLQDFHCTDHTFSSVPQVYLTVTTCLSFICCFFLFVCLAGVLVLSCRLQGVPVCGGPAALQQRPGIVCLLPPGCPQRSDTAGRDGTNRTDKIRRDRQDRTGQAKQNRTGLTGQTNQDREKNKTRQTSQDRTAHENRIRTNQDTGVLPDAASAITSSVCWSVSPGEDLYDVTLTDGDCRLHVTLDPGLNRLVERNILRPGSLLRNATFTPAMAAAAQLPECPGASGDRDR